ncbi:hypothetical protein FHS18_005202 [Paenibacillus phyllosphaerae]|uniref:Lipoprotein n=1 Tax=Paenibacillus phyllosphaerae TaxID=274593 RepID=A0A7W5FQJ2_9BACL|nr:hypothetical protein [Paenibacillus phyllosphaerae]MBB3113099.1 hypothetical protein [Paenibacillus phyllosphaerae]
MRLVALFIVFALVFVGCNTTNKMPKEIPDDFAFSVQFGIGSKNVIDSFNGVVIKDLIVAGTAEAKINFTQEEMLNIYEKMKIINVLGSKDFVDDMSCSREPSGDDVWKIRINGNEQTIQWSSEYCELSDDAKHFEDLRNFVLDIVKEKDEYKTLPEPKGGYE